MKWTPNKTELSEMEKMGFEKWYLYPNIYILKLPEEWELLYRSGHPDDEEWFIETHAGDDIDLYPSSLNHLKQIIEAFTPK
jgi:hypothetical protein